MPAELIDRLRYDTPPAEQFAVVRDEVLYVGDRWQVIAVHDGRFARRLLATHPNHSPQRAQWHPVPAFECGYQPVQIARAFGACDDQDVAEAELGSGTRLRAYAEQMRAGIEQLRRRLHQLRDETAPGS